MNMYEMINTINPNVHYIMNCEQDTDPLSRWTFSNSAICLNGAAATVETLYNYFSTTKLNGSIFFTCLNSKARFIFTDDIDKSHFILTFGDHLA